MTTGSEIGPDAIHGTCPLSGQKLTFTFGTYDGDPAAALFVGASSQPVILHRDTLVFVLAAWEDLLTAGMPAGETASCPLDGDTKLTLGIWAEEEVIAITRDRNAGESTVALIKSSLWGEAILCLDAL